MAFSPKSGMTNETKISAAEGYYIGPWGEETEIINSSGLLISGVAGITTGSGAAAGSVGESFTVNGTAADFTATATVINVCSQALTSGNYLVIGVIQTRINGATMTGPVNYSISTNSASITGTTLGIDRGEVMMTGGTNASFHSGSLARILNLSGAATVYLTASASFSAGNPQKAGSLQIVRIS